MTQQEHDKILLPVVRYLQFATLEAGKVLEHMSEWVVVRGRTRYIVICEMYMSLVTHCVIGDVDIMVIAKDLVLGAYEVRAPRSSLPG